MEYGTVKKLVCQLITPGWIPKGHFLDISWVSWALSICSPYALVAFPAHTAKLQCEHGLIYLFFNSILAMGPNWR